MKQKSIQSLILLAFFSMAIVSADVTLAQDKGNFGPWIGVYAQPIDEDIEEAFNLSRSDGIVIVDVLDGSPAEDAGLREKDIIIKFNNENVDGTIPLKDFVLDTQAGDEVNITFVRDDNEKTATVIIGNRPKSSNLEKSFWGRLKSPDDYSYTFMSGPSGYIGVGILDLNDQLGEYFGVENGDGVLVAEVEEDSPAENAGFQAGDVITGVDDENVNTTDELREFIGAMEEGDEATISYLRNKKEHTVTVEIAEREPEFRTFGGPHINIPSPGSKHYGLRWFGNGDSDFHFDNQRSEMDELRDQIKKLQEEISKIKEKLE